ncbi:helix-turn-helix transcriptional regulator [Kitasatospora sp. NPDC005748]|uniref:helix-turn-helix domain-containing protein n=1 Tax=Kitasatospora sp. NPDC005748 TaxID=3157063 RepID=UPI0034075FE1
MPGRPNPTLRQRRLGAELRRMREQAGLGGSQLARVLGVSPTQVTQMESGKTSVNVDRLHTIMAACNYTNQSLIGALAEIIASRGKGWWEEYRGLIPNAFLESAEHEDFAAGTVKVWTSVFLPGLLQTSEYAQGMFSRKIPGLTAREIELRTSFRRKRRDTFLQSPGKKLEVYVHESSLLTRFGGTDVLREQLFGVVDDSVRANVSVRVVPFGVHTHPGPIESILYSFGAVSELDTVEMESSRGPIFFDAPDELESYRSTFDRIERAALTCEESRDLIQRTARSLKG